MVDPITMKRVSVTELLTWQQNPFEWWLRYVKRLQSPETPLNLVTGSTVHRTIEARLKGEMGSATMEEYAEGHLRRLVEQRDDAEEQVARRLPGIKRALSRVPGRVWEEEWHVEERMEWQFGATVIVVGKPDLFKVTDDEVSIVDFKTTDKDPLDYLLGSPQLRYYAVLLSKLFPDRPVWIQYVCLPTGQYDKAKVHAPWLVKPRALEVAEREMVGIAEDVGSRKPIPFYSGLVDFSEYKEVYVALVTGGDWEAVARENYVERPRKDNE